MSLESTINEQLKTAMKAKDEAGLRSLRAIKSAILLAKTSEGGSGTLTEADEQKLLQKLVKQRRDSLDIYRQSGREDLAAKEAEELKVIEGFLPAQLTDAELEAEVAAIISQTGAASPADLGRVMGVASKALAGRADGKAVAAKVKELLSR